MATGKDSQRMPGLDGLRALAVIAVVWHHSHPGYAALPISRNGFLGVDVFFVLSGFLITTLLLNERRATGSISLQNFYVRRSLRIFPLYYLVLAFLTVYFLVMSAGANAAAFLSELPWHASYTSNWVPLESMMAITWSLSTEEQFYLVWPPVLAWCGARSLWPLLAFLGLNQAVNFGLLDSALNSVGLPYAALSILQVTFTPILLGVLLAFGMKRAGYRRLIEKLPSWAPLVGAVVLLALANIPGDLRGWPRLLFHMATACVIALVVLRPRSSLVRALEWRPLVYVGTVSYGVYLLHKLVLHVLNRGYGGAAVESPELLFAVAMLGTVSVAALSFHYIEAPILGLKARFR